MGAGNVIAVLLYHRRLDHRAMRLLVHMASVSLDPPGTTNYGPCLYWARPEDQAAALGWIDWKADKRDRMLRKVRAQLVDAGAIVRIRNSARRRSPTWEVVIDPLSGPSRSGLSGPSRSGLSGPSRSAREVIEEQQMRTLALRDETYVPQAPRNDHQQDQHWHG